MQLQRWKRKDKPRSEDNLLLNYCGKVGGIIYAEVPIGKDWPPADSERRYIDGVRIRPAAESKEESEIITFTSGISKEFTQAIAGKEVEVIEVKRKLNRPAIGQVIVGADVFEREYKCLRLRRVLVCAKGDSLLEDFCKRHDIKVEQVPVTVKTHQKKSRKVKLIASD